MQTTYQLIPVTGTVETFTADLPKEPSLSALETIIEPLLDGADFERVAVLHNGKQADMFVDEHGRSKGLPVNPAASEIYRAWAMKREPGTRAAALPAIYGAAVLFSRPVWF